MPSSPVSASQASVDFAPFMRGVAGAGKGVAVLVDGLHGERGRLVLLDLVGDGDLAHTTGGNANGLIGCGGVAGRRLGLGQRVATGLDVADEDAADRGVVVLGAVVADLD